VSANTSSERFTGSPKCLCPFPISADSTRRSWITAEASRRRKGTSAEGFYLSYDDTNCEYLTGEQIDERLDAGVDVVSATYVTPYPPGFPVLVPGQVFSRGILQFMRDLDTPEIHGYLPEFGYRVYTQKAIEMAGESVGLTSNGHGAAVQSAAPAPQKASKKKSAKRAGFNGDQNVPEVGQDELLVERQPGDAVGTTSS
jgi:arginine decarboxylase